MKNLIFINGTMGAGKTTTIKMLTCLAKPTEGEAFVGGYSIINKAEQVKKLMKTYLIFINYMGKTSLKKYVR